ncbi:MAG: DNA-binding protein [Candidatus Omnitrophota bacterium]
MMAKKWLCWFLFFAATFGAARVAEAAVPSKQLLENAGSFDGHPVEYIGEAIGEILKRDDYAWVSLHDGENAVSIWLPTPLAERIEFLGNYKTSGDNVYVKGIFHRSCAEHGGAMDIHAMETEILRRGMNRSEILVKKKIVAVLWLLGVLACLLIAHIIQTRRRRK